MGVVETLTDRVAVMGAGRLEEQGECAAPLARLTRDDTRPLLPVEPRPSAP